MDRSYCVRCWIDLRCREPILLSMHPVMKCSKWARGIFRRRKLNTKAGREKGAGGILNIKRHIRPSIPPFFFPYLEETSAIHHFDTSTTREVQLF